MGQTNVMNHIINIGEATPIKVPPRQFPFHYADQIHAQLQAWPRKESSTQAQALGAPQFCMYQKNSGEVRICVDFVKLNQVTKKDSYPVP